MNNLRPYIQLFIAFAFISIIQIFISHNEGIEAKSYDEFTWSEDVKLTWSDFQSLPDYENDFVKALTASSIRYKYSCQEDSIFYTVEAVFKRNESWVKPIAITQHILDHEQLHFDITELFAREMRKELGKQTYLCDNEDQFQEKVDFILSEWRYVQMAYDKETFYSVREDDQARWEENVEKQMMRTHHAH